MKEKTFSYLWWGFWLVLTILIFFAVRDCNKTIEKKGIKGVVEDIWYGKDSTKVEDEKNE